jgi:hypothetical protein
MNCDVPDVLATFEKCPPRQDGLEEPFLAEKACRKTCYFFLQNEGCGHHDLGQETKIIKADAQSLCFTPSARFIGHLEKSIQNG